MVAQCSMMFFLFFSCVFCVVLALFSTFSFCIFHSLVNFLVFLCIFFSVCRLLGCTKRFFFFPQAQADSMKKHKDP